MTSEQNSDRTLALALGLLTSWRHGIAQDLATRSRAARDAGSGDRGRHPFQRAVARRTGVAPGLVQPGHTRAVSPSGGSNAEHILANSRPPRLYPRAQIDRGATD